MLSRKAQYSLVNAKAYFEEHLSTGDYYSEGEKIVGEWFGEGAEALRLSGVVRDAQARALRVELTDESFYVFPYDHLGLVKFEPQKDGDQVHVLVGRYEIQIVGRNLRELGLAFQKCAVDWVREIPARYDLDADGDQVWINSVIVEEVDE